MQTPEPAFKTPSSLNVNVVVFGIGVDAVPTAAPRGAVGVEESDGNGDGDGQLPMRVVAERGSAESWPKLCLSLATRPAMAERQCGWFSPTTPLSVYASVPFLLSAQLPRATLQL